MTTEKINASNVPKKSETTKFLDRIMASGYDISNFAAFQNQEQQLRMGDNTPNEFLDDLIAADQIELYDNNIKNATDIFSGNLSEILNKVEDTIILDKSSSVNSNGKALFEKTNELGQKIKDLKTILGFNENAERLAGLEAKVAQINTDINDLMTSTLSNSEKTFKYHELVERRDSYTNQMDTINKYASRNHFEYSENGMDDVTKRLNEIFALANKQELSNPKTKDGLRDLRIQENDLLNGYKSTIRKNQEAKDRSQETMDPLLEMLGISKNGQVKKQVQTVEPKKEEPKPEISEQTKEESIETDPVEPNKEPEEIIDNLTSEDKEPEPEKKPKKSEEIMIRPSEELVPVEPKTQDTPNDDGSNDSSDPSNEAPTVEDTPPEPTIDDSNLVVDQVPEYSKTSEFKKKCRGKKWLRALAILGIIALDPVQIKLIIAGVWVAAEFINNCIKQKKLIKEKEYDNKMNEIVEAIKKNIIKIKTNKLKQNSQTATVAPTIDPNAPTADPNNATTDSNEELSEEDKKALDEAIKNIETSVSAISRKSIEERINEKLAAGMTEEEAKDAIVNEETLVEENQSADLTQGRGI